MNIVKSIMGIVVFLIGVAMLFFDQTKSIGPFPLGFGLGLAGAGLNS